MGRSECMGRSVCIGRGVRVWYVCVGVCMCCRHYLQFS